MSSVVEELQNAPEPKKRKIIAAFSALIALIVIALWFNYFGSIIAPTDETPQTAQTIPAGQSLQGAAATMYDNFAGSIRAFFAHKR